MNKILAFAASAAIVLMTTGANAWDGRHYRHGLYGYYGYDAPYNYAPRHHYGYIHRDCIHRAFPQCSGGQ
jgi:hypothetical protein